MKEITKDDITSVVDCREHETGCVEKCFDAVSLSLLREVLKESKDRRKALIDGIIDYGRKYNWTNDMCIGFLSGINFWSDFDNEAFVEMIEE